MLGRVLLPAILALPQVGHAEVAGWPRTVAGWEVSTSTQGCTLSSAGAGQSVAWTQLAHGRSEASFNAPAASKYAQIEALSANEHRKSGVFSEKRWYTIDGQRVTALPADLTTGLAGVGRVEAHIQLGGEAAAERLPMPPAQALGALAACLRDVSPPNRQVQAVPIQQPRLHAQLPDFCAEPELLEAVPGTSSLYRPRPLRFAMHVSPAGKVTRATPIDPIGNGPAARTVWKAAYDVSFVPATDAAGKPVASTAEYTVTLPIRFPCRR